MTADLVQFLRARLDEDHSIALAAGEASGGPDDPPLNIRIGAEDEAPIAEHIARHDPERVLAEVDAKRHIVDYVARELEDLGADNPWWYDDKLLPILRLLALPYADHPEYHSEWAP